MAKTHPDGWRELEVSGAAAREIETLQQLSAALPDSYTVYHAVHWTTLEGGRSIYGEVDFAIVNGAGGILLIEQKSGFLDETRHGLAKRHPGRSRSVAAQISRSLQALRKKLGERLGSRPVILEYLLYCPDYAVRNPGTEGIDPGRIVDAQSRERLAQRVREILPECHDEPRAQKVHRFLRDVIQLETDVSVMIGRARTLVTRISGGLAHWARQFEIEPFRLRVTGTAGSGKTQLALAEFRAAVEQGRRPLYVCYNRPLADHFGEIAPAGGVVSTFHTLCDQLVQAHGLRPDFTAPGAFERLVEAAGAIIPAGEFVFDTVIIDEGQDFSVRWRDMVLRHASAGARLLWLEDPMQNLYAREPVPLPGWAGLRAQGNYRSPRSIVRMLEALLPPGDDIEALSPVCSGEVEFLTYADRGELRARVSEALRMCYSAGFRKDDVAIITFRGRDNSVLLKLDAIGHNRLRRFTGEYDLFGSPTYTEGEVLTESVYRFKGQAAPAVILAEVDFEALDERTVRKLFVGATRAMMKLVVVLSERAAAKLDRTG